MTSLVDMTTRVQKALASASDSLSGLLKKGTQKALDTLSRSITFINNNIYSLYQNFGGKKKVQTEVKPSVKKSILRPDAKPAKKGETNILALEAETQQLLQLADITTSLDDLDDGKVFVVASAFDTSSASNVVFGLGDTNTSMAVVMMKKRADQRLPESLRKAKNGYDTLLTVTFIDPERNDYRFSETFENDGIKYDNIHNRLVMKDIEYDAFLEEVRVMYSARPEPAGGCSDREHFPKLKIDGKMYHAHSPKSSQNNCAIMCYIKKLKLNGRLVRSLRNKCGFAPNTKIHVDDLWKISKELGCGHIVYNADDRFNIINQYDFKNEKIVELVLAGEHYQYIVGEPAPQHTCKLCHMKYRKKHNCNPDRVDFYKRNIGAESKQWVQNHKYKIKDKKGIYDHIFFDLECFPLGDGRQHVPYAVGYYMNGEFMPNLYGKNSFEEFLDVIVSVRGKTICAYNGSKYDFYPLMNGLMKRGVKIKNYIINAGKILMLEFNGNRVFDLCLFTQSSLKKACTDFKCKVNKTEFDHNKIRSWEDVETYKDEVEPYLKNDVACLKELYTKFLDLFHGLEGVNISTFVTLSHMAYDLWTNTVKENTVELFQDQEKYDFSSRSNYGGRCYPMKKHTKSTHYDDVVSGKMTYDELYKSKQYIFNGDVTSLYPSAMKGVSFCPVKFPAGKSRWSDDPETEFRNGKIGIYEIKWDAPKDIRIAVLPDKKVGDGLYQSVAGGDGVFNSIDIENAESCGYTIQFIGKCLVWDQTVDDLFDEYVSRWFGVKNDNSGDGGNKSLRAIAKLMINALYGKMLQGILNDGSKFCYNIKDVWDFRRKYQVKDWSIHDDGRKCLRLSGIMYDEDQAKHITKPRQLGSFILGYSRRIMLYYMKQIDPSLKSRIFTYMDTDSLHISGEAHQLLVEKGICVSKEESSLGLLCSDIDDEGLIIEEINTGAKNYMYVYLTNKNEIKVTMKCKGIPKTDTLGSDSNLELLREELWRSDSPTEIEYTSFKKVQNPTKQQRADGIEPFSVITVEQKRTWNKNPYGRMIFYEGEWYPFGFDFSSLKVKG